jgi:hypothetical protein
VVQDIEQVEKDRGLAEVLKHLELHDLSRQRRRELLRRWRRARTRVSPSPSTVFRYLDAFQDPVQESLREQHTHEAFVPEPNEHLRGLMRVNDEVIAQAQLRAPQGQATLDLDATLIQTWKEIARQGYKAYQPLNVWWAEHELMLHSEFRDGNVPANFDNLRVLQEAMDRLPEGIEKVAFRADCAAYQVDLMRALDQGRHPRFGRIEFAISVPVDKEFKKSVAEMNRLHDEEPEPRGKVKVSPWKPLVGPKGTDRLVRQEYAEVHHEPCWQVHSKRQRIGVRFIAIREPFEERALPGLEDQHQQRLPFQTLAMGQRSYKLFGMVTNRPGPVVDTIWWHRKRCGKSEEAHSMQKSDFAGGRLPSGKAFGANAAWWHIMVLAMNLNTVMKRLVLAKIDEHWLTRRMKAIRFHLINVAGRIVEHARRFVICLARDHPSTELLFRARERIRALAAQG